MRRYLARLRDFGQATQVKSLGWSRPTGPRRASTTTSTQTELGIDIKLSSFLPYYYPDDIDVEVQTDDALQQGGLLTTTADASWVGSWEPLAKQEFPMDFRVRLCREQGDIPAGEMGWVVQDVGAKCGVRFDYYLLPVMCLTCCLEAWVPGDIAVASSTRASQPSTAWHLEQQDVETQTLDACEQGHSSSAPLACKTHTAYTKLLAEFRAALDLLRLNLDVAPWPPPRDDLERMWNMRDTIQRVYQVLEDTAHQLQEHQEQERCDSYTQVGPSLCVKDDTPQ